MSRALAVSALLLATGGTLVLSELRWFSRQPLAERLRPYGPGGLRSSAVGAGVFSVESFREVIGPLARQAGERVAGLFGVDEDLAVRLRRIHSTTDPTAFRVRQLGWAATPARADAEVEPVKVMQRVAVSQQRPDDRNFIGHEFCAEGMLFQNLRVTPAARPIELGNDDGGFVAAGVRCRLPGHGSGCFQMHLVHAVFVGTQRHQAAITIQAYRCQGVQHHIGCQRFKRMRWANRLATLMRHRPSSSRCASQAGRPARRIAAAASR